MSAASPVRRTLVAGTAASCVAFIVLLLYVNPWGVPRIVAFVLIGSFVVAVATGKFLAFRGTSSYLDGFADQPPRPDSCLTDWQALHDGVSAAPTLVLAVSRAPVRQSSAAPSPGH